MNDTHTLHPRMVGAAVAKAFGVPLQLNFESPAKAEGHMVSLTVDISPDKIAQLTVVYDIYVETGAVDTVTQRFQIVRVED